MSISQKVLIGINQFYRLHVGVCNDLPSNNLVNQKKKKYFFYNYKKYITCVYNCRLSQSKQHTL